MIRTSTLRVLFSALAALVLSFISPLAAKSQSVYYNSGTSTSYNLGNGDSLVITGGTYTGSISNFHQNARITVLSGANFQPANLNNGRGTVRVYGTATFGSIDIRNNFDLYNYNITKFNNSVSFNNDDVTFVNAFNATMTFTQNLTLSKRGSFSNKGKVIIGNTFTLNESSMTVTNENEWNMKDFTYNDGTLLNQGKFYATGNMNINGTTTFTNTCRIITDGNFTNNSTLFNSGLVWLTTAGKTFTNNEKIISTGGNIKTTHFTNYGTFTFSGKNKIYATGTTTNTEVLGVTGITTDSLLVYDVTRTGTQIFDNQWATLRPNVKYAVLTIDTDGSPSGCASSYMLSSGASGITLPVKWNYFNVTVNNNTPALLWSVETEAGTIFELQRSYDKTNYTAFATITADGRTEYQYTDRNVNTQNKTVYYRMKATEANGNIKISDVRIVNFDNTKTQTIQITPNPFTSQFAINFQGSDRGTVTIKVFSVNGKEMLQTNTTTTVGFNRITISNVDRLTKGVYMVQITDANGTQSSQTIVKQ